MFVPATCAAGRAADRWAGRAVGSRLASGLYPDLATRAAGAVPADLFLWLLDAMLSSEVVAVLQSLASRAVLATVGLLTRVTLPWPGWPPCCWSP